jgi:hypothetical protein
MAVIVGQLNEGCRYVDCGRWDVTAYLCDIATSNCCCSHHLEVKRLARLRVQVIEEFWIHIGSEKKVKIPG